MITGFQALWGAQSFNIAMILLVFKEKWRFLSQIHKLLDSTRSRVHAQL